MSRLQLVIRDYVFRLPVRLMSSLSHSVLAQKGSDLVQNGIFPFFLVFSFLSSSCFPSVLYLFVICVVF